MRKHTVLLIKQGQKIRGICPSGHIDDFFKLYEPFSLKGIVWSRIVKIFSKLGLETLFFKKENPAFVIFHGLTYFDLLQLFESFFGKKIFQLLIMFPYDQCRGRVSGFALSDNMFFFKLSLKAEDKIALSKEVSALKFIKNNNIDCFHIPQLINTHSFNRDKQLNIYEPLPPNARKIRSMWNPLVQKAWENFSRKTIHYVDINDFNLNIKKEIHFEIKKNNEYKFCCIHGDFAPWNIRVDSNDQLWIYDWEDFANSAPYLTDPIHYITQTEYLIKKSSRGSI